MSKIDNENDAAIGNKDTAIRINDSYVLFMDRYSLWVIKEAKAKTTKPAKSTFPERKSQAIAVIMKIYLTALSKGVCVGQRPRTQNLTLPSVQKSKKKRRLLLV